MTTPSGQPLPPGWENWPEQDKLAFQKYGKVPAHGGSALRKKKQFFDSADYQMKLGKKTPGAKPEEGAEGAPPPVYNNPK
eukprot:m51a1_g423 hypothetical protein (80) ;mRNA; f:23457-23861